MGRVELEIPVSANIRSLGLRPSAFIDFGSVFGLKTPNLEDITVICNANTSHPNVDIATAPPEFLRPGDGFTCTDTVEAGGPSEQVPDRIAQTGFREFYLGDSPKPRLSIGVGVNWVSPFGPLRVDIAKAILTQEGDETKFFSFNVGTQF